MKKLLAGMLVDRMLGAASLAFALAGMWLVFEASAKRVHVLVDGELLRVRTHSRTVGQLIEELGRDPGPADQLNFPPETPLESHMLVTLERAQEIRLSTFEGDRIVRTASRTPANILAEADFPLFAGDELWLDDIVRIDPFERMERPPGSIRVVNGKSIVVKEGGSERKLRSSATTVGQALLSAGIPLYEGDRVSPALKAIIEPGMSVEINRSRDLVLEMADRRLPVKSAAATVSELLMEVGVPLTGMDYTVPGPEESIPSDGVIQIVQVDEELLVELEPIPFETVYQPLDTLELDNLQVQSAGTFGVQAERVRIRYEDGEEINRTVEEAVSVVEPEPRVIGYGTKIVVRSLSTGSGTIEYWRAIPVYATSYSPCNLGVNRCGYTTASGRGVDRGVIGVIRSWFNQMRGWPVYVPGYGSGSIEDIGGGFSDRDWIDLGFTDDEYEAWHDWTTLYFLTPIPPADQIPWILP